MPTDTFNEKLIERLKTDTRFVDTAGQLITAAVKDAAWKLDTALIKSLLSEPELKAKFFTEIEGHWVFNYNAFITYLSDKNFLANAYTRFRNKIGLNIDEKFLPERGEVALVWPYKDCVLEGGQTREEEKRTEVFFNEFLAPDEINRLLAPKVLTNWKRHTRAGEQPVTALKRADDGTLRENLLVKGNNLLALHSLKLQFRGKVKCAYIDPPYNTGGAADSFTYNNTFNHSTWLTFMRNRLEVARELLRADGFIAIAIDQHELFYLGVLADEIFGRENRLGVITVVHKPEGRSQEKFFGTSNEFMLVYARDKTRANFRKVLISEEKKAAFNLTDEKGNYKLRSFIRGEALRQDRPHFFYPIYVSPELKDISLTAREGYHQILPISNNAERVWFLKPESFLARVRDGEIVAQKNQRGEIKIFYKVREVEVFTTHWVGTKYNAITHGTKLLEKIIGRKGVSYPKSLYTVLDILKLTTDAGDIIVDFFAGSGTTGHAVVELNRCEGGGERQFILIEQLEEHVAVCTERLEKVLAQEGLVSTDFLSCELMPYNAAFVARIQAAHTSDELVALWREMTKESFLNWYVNAEMPEEAIDDFIAIGDVKQQQSLLMELLDKNQLYVNLSEMEDEEFRVSDEDKVLNSAFYAEAPTGSR